MRDEKARDSEPTRDKETPITQPPVDGPGKSEGGSDLGESSQDEPGGH